MAIVPRSSILMPGDSIVLDVTFRGFNGLPQDPAIFPNVTIVQPNGGIAIGPTSAGVTRTGVGTYEFIYAAGLNPSIGVWKDIWQGDIDGYTIVQELNFVVFTTQTPAINSDGYLHLGDDPGMNFSQTAIMNINKMIKKLRTRLNSSGKHRTTDEFGNPKFVQCDIFDLDELVTFICNALSAFNQIPHFTEFTFEDTNILETFCEVIVQHAHLSAMAAKALIERGREFNITDNGLSFQPPTVSDALIAQYTAELNNWWEKVKVIKNNMKPASLGLGTLRPLAANPSFLRLRHLRARQII